MSDQVLSAITSLAASVGSLQAQVAALNSQVAGKSDTTTVSALTARVSNSELGEPFFAIDGQAFITKATVESPAIDPCTYSLKVTMGDDGRFYIAGVGIGVSTVARELNLGPSLEKDVRRLLREELQPGGILHRS